MPKLPKKISVVDSIAEFFFHLKTYLLGYGKIDFEGILGVPFFMVTLTPARCAHNLEVTSSSSGKTGSRAQK